MRSNLYILLVTLLLLPVWLSSQGASGWSRQGDRAYREGKFADARARYEKSLEKKEDDRVRYDLGNADYRAGDHAAAQRAYETTRNSKQKELADRSLFNLGNALYRQDSFERSAACFSEYLRRHPGDPDAKRNLFLAKSRAAQQESSAPQQSSRQNQDQEQAAGSRQAEQQNGQGDKAEDRRPDQQGKESRQQQQPGQEQQEGSGTQEGRAQAPPSGRPSGREFDQIRQSIREADQRAAAKMRRQSGTRGKQGKDW